MHSSQYNACMTHYQFIESCRPRKNRLDRYITFVCYSKKVIKVYFRKMTNNNANDLSVDEER